MQKMKYSIWKETNLVLSSRLVDQDLWTFGDEEFVNLYTSGLLSELKIYYEH